MASPLNLHSHFPKVELKQINTITQKITVNTFIKIFVVKIFPLLDLFNKIHDIQGVKRK